MVEGAPTIFPSINSSKETKDGKGGGGAHERRSLLEPPRDRMRQCGVVVEISLTVRTWGPARPQTAAENPKILRFEQERYQTQSVAVTPSRVQQQGQQHLSRGGLQQVCCLGNKDCSCKYSEIRIPKTLIFGDSGGPSQNES